MKKEKEMKYFEGLTEEVQIKKRYKELSKKYHPDLGGDVEIMKEINLQYEKVLCGYYQKAGKSAAEIEEILEKDELLRNKLNQIIMLDDLIIEVCGFWLWVTGNTKGHKELLKNFGFFWSSNKKSWYWRSESNKSYNRKSFSLDEIRKLYGSHEVRKKQMAALS